MPALCLMLSGTYYAKNYAGIIGRGLNAFQRVFLDKAYCKVDFKARNYTISDQSLLLSTNVLNDELYTYNMNDLIHPKPNSSTCSICTT